MCQHTVRNTELLYALHLQLSTATKSILLTFVHVGATNLDLQFLCSRGGLWMPIGMSLKPICTHVNAKIRIECLLQLLCEHTKWLPHVYKIWMWRQTPKETASGQWHTIHACNLYTCTVRCWWPFEINFTNKGSCCCIYVRTFTRIFLCSFWRLILSVQVVHPGLTMTTAKRWLKGALVTKSPLLHWE